MADIFSEVKRSQIMSKISGKETKPEVLVRKLLFAEGFRFRKNDKRLAGKPDVVLPKYRTVIFVNGCFWHGHQECKKAALPNTRRDFWEQKISSNVSRDARIIERLQQDGWRVITVWQCQLKNQQEALETLDKTAVSLRADFKPNSRD